MRRSYHSNFAFLDVLFNTLLCFAACFAIALIFMSQKKADTDVKFAAYVMVIATWPAAFSDDIDLYIKDPNDEVIFFRNKSNAIMHLDRDDLGRAYLEEDSQESGVPPHREIVTIRRQVKGEYVVNAHAYAKYSDGPLPVSIKIIKLSPRYEIFDDILIFDEAHQEKTVCRFTVSDSGRIRDVNKLPLSIAREILGSSPQ